MAIPESQLETWARQGAIATAKATHESIRRVLGEASSLRRLDFEVYVQGSYKNDTNIRGDSNVDIVVQLNSSCHSDRSGLTDPQSFLQQQRYPPATYQWADIRRDVLGVLRAYYVTSLVSEGTRRSRLLPVRDVCRRTLS
jgi:Nucleotidyltransferase domain